MRFLILIFSVFITAGCSKQYSNQQVVGMSLPPVSGQTLSQVVVNIPEDFNKDFTLLLMGYQHKSQFDIDRWLIGLDMTETQVDVYEIPAIQGFFPRMFSKNFDNSMRDGIPKPFWKHVITVYRGGETIQAFTGNERPKNARVLLLNKEGTILYFYDNGFSVPALNKLRYVLSVSN